MSECIVFFIVVKQIRAWNFDTVSVDIDGHVDFVVECDVVSVVGEV